MNGFGLVAILLGVLACITCWIPLIGLVSLPLSGLGLLFGVIGFIVSITGKRSGMSLPIAGTVLCVVAIVIALGPIFLVGAAATGAAHEASRKSTAGSERSRTPAWRLSPALPAANPAPQELAEEKTRRDAGVQMSLAAEKAAADEQVERERIEADKRVEIARIHREESRAKLLPLFRAATNKYGLLLVRNNLQAWATSLEVTARDEDLLTFSGRGLDESVLPFADLKFSGRITNDGKLVLDLSTVSGSLEFDTFLEVGMFTMSPRGEYSLTPLNATLQQERAARRDEVAQILEQKLAEPTITLYDSADEKRYKRVQAIKYAFAAAEVNVRGQQAEKDGALCWVDGDLGTVWHLGGNPRNAPGTYSVRYKNHPKAKGIGLFIYPYDMFEDDSLKTVTLTVNGERRVPLPSYQSCSNSHAFIEIRFPEEISVFELRFDVLNGNLPIGEIVLIVDREPSVETHQVGKLNRPTSTSRPARQIRSPNTMQH
jgi:hypothetical protein